MAYVFKRGERFYIGYQDETGRARRVSTKATTAREAKRIADELEVRSEHQRKGITPKNVAPHAWDELCERYLRDVAPNHRSHDTTVSQMRAHVSGAFKGRALVGISPADIDAWVTGLRKKGLADSTRELLRVRVQALFTYAVRKLEWLSVSPAAKSTRLRVPRRATAYLSREELAAVLAVQSPIRNEIAVAAMSGLRRGEVAGLKREDVDLPGRHIYVRRSFTGDTTKGGAERPVPILPELAPYLRDALRASKDPSWVFPSPRGGPRSTNWQASKEFRRVLKAAGISRPVSFKTLRATWGTFAYEATGDIRFVQEVLGHSDAKVTARHYAHVVAKQRLAQADRVSFAALPENTHKNTDVQESRTMDGGKPSRDQVIEGAVAGKDGEGLASGRRTTGPRRKKPYRTPALKTVVLRRGTKSFRVVSRREKTGPSPKSLSRKRGAR